MRELRDTKSTLMRNVKVIILGEKIMTKSYGYGNLKGMRTRFREGQ